MRSLALYYISIPCFAFLRKYTLYPTCRLLLIDLPRTADYNYKGSISSSGPLPVQESWNHMQDLKHVFSYLKPYRRDLFLAVGLVFVECIFEMVIPMLMSDLVDQGVPSHDMQVIMLQGCKMIICAVLALITGLLYARFAARAANGFAAALREAEYRKLQQFGFANLDHFSTPSLVTRMTTDVTVMLNAVATGLRPLVRSPVMLFMGLGMAFLLNAKLTIVFLITTPILAAILAWIVTKVGPLYDRQQTAVDHLNGRVQEALTAIRAIKAFVRGDYENEQFETVNDELAAASTNTFRYAVLNLPAFQAVMYTAIVCIMWYGGNFILTDRMTVGELTAFLSYVLQVLNSVMMFSGVFLQLTRSLTSARRIRAVLEEQVGRGERQATGVAKAPFVAAFVRALLDNGEKVLLFAHHHAVMDIYKKELTSYHPAFLTGRETTKQKDDAVARFMEGKTNLCVISLRAASGLNLQRASCVVFGELDWSPAVHSQAEDRAHRMGQKDSILCYYLVAPQGSDRDMQDALGLKVSQFVALMGDKTPELSSVQDAQQAAKAHIEKMLEQYDAAQTNERG